MGGESQKPINHVRDLRCPPGRYIDRYKTKTGHLLDNIEVWCNGGHYMEQRGGGGGDVKESYCAGGFDQVKLKSGPDHIDGIQFRCSDGNWGHWGGGDKGSEYVKTCSDNKVITGLARIGLRGGIVAFGSEPDKSLECDNRVDCYNDGNLFHGECRNKSDTRYKDVVSSFCNRDNNNAKSDGCRTWCQNNSDSCWRLRDLNDCAKFNITEGACSRGRIDELVGLCNKYRIITSGSGGSGGEYPCNPNSVSKLRDECREYDIVDDTCSPTELTSAKDRKLEKELTEETQRKAQEAYDDQRTRLDEKYNQTQALIAQNLGIEVPQYNAPKKSKTTEKEPESDNTMTFVIICIVVFIFCCFISSSLAFLVFGISSESSSSTTPAPAATPVTPPPVYKE